MKVDCQWGRAGAAREADVAIIVDVMSFSTCVTIAAGRGARVFPFWGEAEEAEALARAVGGKAASRTRSKSAISLSPQSLQLVAAEDSVVLPSPNGSRCSFEAKADVVLCGSLRNAAQVASFAELGGEDVLVVPAGELWPDGSMRVAFEDMVGAGAIIAQLGGAMTPEARAAAAAFIHAERDLRALLFDCPSGRELVERGYGEDVELAAQLNASACVPMLNLHRVRYRDAWPASEIGERRVRYYENAAA